MARHNENECAYCAAEIAPGKGVIGKDWKVYCCESCAEAGELMELSSASESIWTADCLSTSMSGSS